MIHAKLVWDDPTPNWIHSHIHQRPHQHCRHHHHCHHCHQRHSLQNHHNHDHPHWIGEIVWKCQKKDFQEKYCLATGSYALHTILFLAIWELFVSIVTHICFILDRYFLSERKKRFSAIMKNHLVILWSHSSKKTLAPAFEKFCAVAELQKIKCKGGQMQAHPTQGAQRERGKGKTSSSVEL